MSLRVDIHDAVDPVAADRHAMAARIASAMASAPAAPHVLSRRPRRWSDPLRGVSSLVAALIVIALVVGALMGGRLIADWRKAVAPPQPAIPMTPLQKLEARALHMPKIDVPGHCPSGPYDKNGDYGAAPIHSSGSTASPQTPWGIYFYMALWSDGSVKGPILMRGQDLFTHERTVFIGQYAAGPVVGTDTVDGQAVDQHTEMVIPAVTSPYAWQIEGGVRNDTRCLGWQIDGPDFTETFVFN